MFEESGWSEAEAAEEDPPGSARPLPPRAAAGRRQLLATLQRLEAAARRSGSASEESAASEPAKRPAGPRQRRGSRRKGAAAAADGEEPGAGDEPKRPAAGRAAAIEPPARALNRKQWRNRQKNKRRQKNKFKAGQGGAAGEPPARRALGASPPPPSEPPASLALGASPPPPLEPPASRAAALRLKVEERLDSARFRYLNQLLYTRPSHEAARLFQADPEAFAIYHRGFAQQVARWPQNPVQRFVHYLRHRPVSLVVADFGCGDCTLAHSIRNKVHCFDVVALDPRVTVCDMAQVPLEAASVDVAVFCLALMGTNLYEILEEANRVLCVGGTLLVAEVASRFVDLRAFLGALVQLGFKLVSKDVSGSHFYTLELRKEGPPRRVGGAGTGKGPAGLVLLPCLYKRR